jgi:prepilin-type N-terminal cleavage/methylation domain-containing protein
VTKQSKHAEIASPRLRRARNDKANRTGFTLIELLISIVITLFIASAIYWSMVTALQSWAYMKDELLLQKVLSQTMQELIEGTPDTYGLRDALEMVKAYNNEVEVVYPWSDTIHMAQSGLNVYELDKDIKAGTGIPIGEARAPDTDGYYPIVISMLDWGKKDELNKIQILSKVAPGSRLRFTYHPDPKKDPDAITGYKWVKDEGRIYMEDSSGRRVISKNPFGVKIATLALRYFNNANKEISVGGDVADDDLQFIGGIEISVEAQLPGKGGKEGKKKDLLCFVSLRNSPAKGGAINLKEGMRFPIPDSRRIRTLFLTNLTGIDDRDILQIDAVPERGNDWRLKIAFSRAGLTVPKIASYTIEYPSGKTVFTDSPNTNVDIGLNFLFLGPNGMYDYDMDEEGQDVVDLKGNVELKVTRMDIAGAGIFVK